MGLIKEFKEFALKGNVMDMAVGVIIGGAFGKIVTSLVNDVIMPPVAALVGNAQFSKLSWTLREAVPEKLDEAGNLVHEATDAITLNYGMFVQNIVDFLIVAVCIFFAIKAINKLTRKKETEPEPAAPAGPTQEELLAEIRDLLKNKQ